MSSSPALARHVIDRLGYGPRPGDLERIAAIGTDRWIETQLNPQSIPLPPDLADRLANFATARLSPLQIFVTYGPPSVRTPGEGKLTPEQQQERNRRMQFVAWETIQMRLLRASASPCQLEESLTDFWFSHFNVFLGKGLDRLWLGAYVEEAIRPNILGRFRDLLGATAKHPAMLFFLDNWLNTAPGSPGAKGQFDGLNENYAREVMELHTLGVDGGYVQDDVIALAKILTGWTIGPLHPRQMPRGKRPFAFFRAPPEPPMALPSSGGFVFDPDRHDFTAKRFLGRNIGGSGEDEGEAALDMLARSPATARHIGYKLAQYFVADEPDKKLVAAMAHSFLASDGNIRAVLHTLFASAAFRAPENYGAKFKSPFRYIISSVRAAGVPVTNFRPLEGMLMRLGERSYGCQTPDGYKNTQEAWLNPDAMMQRLSFAVAFATGHLPIDAAPDAPAVAEMARGAGKPALIAAERPAAPGPVLDAAALMRTLGGQFSAASKAAIAAAPAPLQAAMVLGAPEFMRC